MRVAFYGGSFDPPHLGHLRIAQAAADRLALDWVLFAPVAVQPLKREEPAPVSFADRLAMLRLLCADAADPRLTVSELDAPRADGRPNYTVDTLTRLRETLPCDAELFVLLGADAFLTLRHWHRAAELLLAARWIVATRPGFALQSLARIDETLPAGIRPAGEPVPGNRTLCQRLTDPCGASTELYLLPDLEENISATEIRAALTARAGAAPQQVLSPAVLAYIRARELYQQPPGLQSPVR